MSSEQMPLHDLESVLHSMVNTRIPELSDNYTQFTMNKLVLMLK